jgi:hypothetical protein
MSGRKSTTLLGSPRRLQAGRSLNDGLTENGGPDIFNSNNLLTSSYGSRRAVSIFSLCIKELSGKIFT